ncbi:MAG TPA: hypothetical protein PLV75_12055, partial [Saprospiraceae bacterium]|nr:hypothetical protein [Saprospiraceae bacterium]
MINQILSSNYGYTMQKPPGASILDLMGPWPWYILWGEFLMVFLYLLLLAPFLLWPPKPESLSQDKASVKGN